MQNQNTKKKFDDYQKAGCVFKSCEKYIVVLQKLDDTITNESREVFDKTRAKYRGNKFMVLDIIDKYGDESPSNISSDYVSKFVYRKNEIAECENYNQDNKIVCSSGIHYYLDWTTAFHHNLTSFKFHNSNYTGKHYEWFDDGRLKYESYYIEGYQNGEVKEWYNTGVLKAYFNYLDDKLCGEGKTFYPNGQIQREIYYNQGGKLEGSTKHYHENGTLIELKNFKNGVKHGIYKTWDKEGNIEYSCDYKDGNKNGKSYSYFINLQHVYEEMTLKDGMLYGVYRIWNHEGQLVKECNFRNSVRHGPYKIWDQNGKLIEEGEYIDGEEYRNEELAKKIEKEKEEEYRKQYKEHNKFIKSLINVKIRDD